MQLLLKLGQALLKGYEMVLAAIERSPSAVQLFQMPGGDLHD